MSTSVTKSRIALFAAILLAVVANFRSLFWGKNLGDLGDARWTTSIYEHWFQAFSGKVALFEAPFFYPDPGALGYSDSFLPQGLIYSLFRLMHLDIVLSWNLTNLIFCAFLAGSLAFLATMFFDRWYIQFAFVFFGSTSLPLVNQLNHVQTFGYFAAVLIVGLTYRTYKAGAGAKSWFMPAALALLPTLALAAWYGFYFLVLLTFIGVIVTLLLDRAKVLDVAKKLWAVCMASSKLAWFASAIVTVTFSFFFISIYGQAFGISRDFDIFLRHAPRIYNWIDAGRGDGFWGFIFQQFGISQSMSTVERSEGFSPSFFLVFAFAVLISFRKHRAILMLAATSLTTWVLITVFPFEIAPYKLIWEIVPGGSSVRAAFRINIFIFMIALGIVLFLVEKWLAEKNTRTKFAVAALLILAVDQFRIPEATWTAEQFLPSKYSTAVENLKNSECDAFVLNVKSDTDPDMERSVQALHYEVDAVTIASVSGVPTVNGYSAVYPSDYPKPLGYEPEGVAQRVAWAKSNSVVKVCEVLDDGSLVVH